MVCVWRSVNVVVSTVVMNFLLAQSFRYSVNDGAFTHFIVTDLVMAIVMIVTHIMVVQTVSKLP